MFQQLLNSMRLQASMAEQSRVASLLAVVSSYDPTNYCAKVRLMPGDVETGWLPVTSPLVGSGWGFFCPPSVGDTVEVHFQEDDIDAGYISLRFFTDAARPLSVQPGEFWLVHKSGSALKFHNDGSVDLVTNANLNATVGGAMTANVTGNATVNAAEVDLVGAGGTAKGVVQQDCICSYTGTLHPMVSATVKGTK